MAGLAGLAHLYGLFWCVSLILLLWCDARYISNRPFLRGGLSFAAGASVPWLFWIAPVSAHWHDFIGQMAVHRQHFRLLSPAFYLNSLRNEGHRYALGILSLRSLAAPGLWFIILGLPMAMGRLAARVKRTGDFRALSLLLPSALFPLLFALLVDTKRFNYLVTFAPLFSLSLGSVLSELLVDTRHRARRTLAAVLTSLAIVQGGVSIARMQWNARKAIPPYPLFHELKAAIPPGSAVLGDLKYWLAVPDRSYRFFFLPFLLSDSQKNLEPIPFAEAMRPIAPKIVLLDSTTDAYFADRSEPVRIALHEEFWAYMRRRRARLIRTISEADGEEVRVYQLE